MERIAGKYDVVRELGKGSYGRVYLVRHAFLGVPYALKVLNDSFSKDTQVIERFKQEAAILTRFNHPGTVQLRDFGQTEDGLYYMATDFCEGISLREHLRRKGRVEALEALDIAEQLLTVLEAANHVGIIHRDVKPENIMVQLDDDARLRVKILDFGVARLAEEMAGGSSSTHRGMSIGTPLYMSPEQAAGEEQLDLRADIYSAGIVLYELLTGHVPFEGETVLQTLLMHITKPAEPVAGKLGLPGFIDELLFRAIAKDRVHRYQDFRDFLADCLSAEEMVRGAAGLDVSAESPAPVEVLPASAEKPSILCLDDNEMILQILRFILEQQGFQVFTATNFSVIHSYLFSSGTRLMLCDVQMPGLPGTRVCQMLKESMRDLKIILFSNIPERELEKLSLESQADDWLSKNASPSEWLAKIREVAGLSES